MSVNNNYRSYPKRTVTYIIQMNHVKSIGADRIMLVLKMRKRLCNPYNILSNERRNMTFWLIIYDAAEAPITIV